MKWSAVIPVHGGPELLHGCLRALAASHTPPEEIIVVDDGSGADDAARIAQLTAARGAKLLRQAQAGPAVARNLGARAASGEVLWFIDADVEVHADTLGRLRAIFAADPGLDAAFGSYDNQPAGGSLASDYRNLLHHFVHQHSRRQAVTFWAGCGAIRRAIFLEWGGFDASFPRPSIEDVELGLRLAAAGRRIELHPEVQARHAKRWTAASLFRTDLRQRAIPWTQLWLGGGRPLPTDLNFGWRQRLCVALAGLLLVSLPCLVRLPWFGALLARVALGGIGVLQLPLLFFFVRLRGLVFAAAAFPLHLLHLIASVLGLGAGAWTVWRRRDPWGAPVAALLLAAVLATQWFSGAYAADFSGHPDEAGHYVTGVMLADYLKHPVWPPMQFAEEYYLRYPKVALGHWPPLLYVVEGLWFNLIDTCRTSALILQALLGWMLAIAIYVGARVFAPAPAAATAALLAQISWPFQLAVTCVLADSLTALLVLSASAAWAWYMYKPDLVRSQLFGVLAALALLTKGSACPLVLLPPLATAIGRRGDLVRRADFWLAALPVLVLAAPWYLFASTFNTPNRGAFTAGRPVLVETWLEYGWAVLGLGALGVWLLSRINSTVATLCGLWLAFLVTPAAVRAFQEERHLLPAAAAAAMLAAGALARLPGPVWARAALAVVLAALPPAQLLSYAPAVFRPWARQHPLTGPTLVFGTGESPFIAAQAERRPHPEHAVLRASRVVAMSGWSGARYRLTVDDPAVLSQRLDEWGVGMVVRAHRDALPHDRLLTEVTRAWPASCGNGYCMFTRPATAPALAGPARLAVPQPRLGKTLRGGGGVFGRHSHDQP
ncbi:MAG: glycosyltransferase [Bryobacterales bacterium]|nr:glycosyltransferase [Bryobacterales bacterium]